MGTNSHEALQRSGHQSVTDTHHIIPYYNGATNSLDSALLTIGFHGFKGSALHPKLFQQPETTRAMSHWTTRHVVYPPMSN